MTNKEEPKEIDLFLEFCYDYYESPVPTSMDDLYDLIKRYNIFFNRYPVCKVNYYTADGLKDTVRETYIDYSIMNREQVIGLLDIVKNLPSFMFFLVTKEARDYFIQKKLDELEDTI